MLTHDLGKGTHRTGSDEVRAATTQMAVRSGRALRAVLLRTFVEHRQLAAEGRNAWGVESAFDISQLELPKIVECGARVDLTLRTDGVLPPPETTSLPSMAAVQREGTDEDLLPPTDTLPVDFGDGLVLLLHLGQEEFQDQLKLLKA